MNLKARLEKLESTLPRPMTDAEIEKHLNERFTTFARVYHIPCTLEALAAAGEPCAKLLLVVTERKRALEAAGGRMQ